MGTGYSLGVEEFRLACRHGQLEGFAVRDYVFRYLAHVTLGTESYSATM